MSRTDTARDPICLWLRGAKKAPDLCGLYVHSALAELLHVGFGFFTSDVNVLANFGDCFLRGLHIDDAAFGCWIRELSNNSPERDQ